MNETAITIVLPVYGRSELLEPALGSVLAQTSPNWRLLIADDGSDALTQGFLERWLAEHPDPRIRWERRPQNLGLFANLNQAIEEADTEWVLLLCSDDLLLPLAVEAIEKLRHHWPDAGLILSTFESINADGSKRSSDNAWHHDRVTKETALIDSEIFIKSLLRLGSLNGNLTGMAFSHNFWKSTGRFREDWRHAADWEWIARGGGKQPVLFNRSSIARVRTHESQLSNKNRKSGQEIKEVAEVVILLKAMSKGTKGKESEWNAARLMKHQLLNTLRKCLKRQWKDAWEELVIVRKTSGLSRTSMAFMIWVAAVGMRKIRRKALFIIGSQSATRVE